MARATRADVAKMAGVSLGTVSHVVNGRAEELGFAPATIEKVQKAARELGYIPHAAARAFRYRTSKIITFFISEIPESLRLPVFSELVLSAIASAGDQGYFVLPVLVSPKDPDPLQIIEQTLGQVEIAGVICEDLPHLHQATDLLEKAEVQTAWINPRGLATANEPGHFGVDEQEGVASLINSIDTRGIKHAVYLTGPGKPTDRLLPFRDHFENLTIIEADTWFTHEGRESMHDFLKSGAVPDLVFGANDHLATGALAALREAQIDVPNEVQVFGYGNYELASSPLIQLSSVTWPLPELGDLAVKSLLQKKPLAHRNIKTSAQPRGTTRPK